MRICLHAHGGVRSVKKIILAGRWGRATRWSRINEELGLGNGIRDDCRRFGHETLSTRQLRRPIGAIRLIGPLTEPAIAENGCPSAVPKCLIIRFHTGDGAW